MAESTGISWTDATFNIAWGCEKISPGCAHCYAEAQADNGRMAYRQAGEIVGVWGRNRPRRTFGESHWNEPRRWNAKAQERGTRMRVFSSSMTDVFLDDATIDAEREKLWPLIRETPWLDWQLLTKRADRIAQCLPEDWAPDTYFNVWLGVSIESDDYAHRADYLRQIPAVVRFVSYEPALGPLDALNLDGLHWVIYGAESGPNRRPEDKDWARRMHQRCYDAGVAFYHKQSSGLRSGTGVELDGQIVHDFPAVDCPPWVHVPGLYKDSQILTPPAVVVQTAADRQRLLFGDD